MKMVVVHENGRGSWKWSKFMRPRLRGSLGPSVSSSLLLLLFLLLLPLSLPNGQLSRERGEVVKPAHGSDRTLLIYTISSCFSIPPPPLYIYEITCILSPHPLFSFSIWGSSPEVAPNVGLEPTTSGLRVPCSKFMKNVEVYEKWSSWTTKQLQQ